ncbi:Dirigent domain-containing protein [Cephalotus follicularis]|uniref:Dirigent protein n=1 Tax=Cephalotus follicularis TaxID=3775 RepID=A0A1Q3B7H2_CEPFO|nr:Dirigent domain-containing protein [Cephalotus follicularis]
MARTLSKPTCTFLILFTVPFSLILATSEPNPFDKTLSPSSLGLKEATLTHLHFYFHDTVTGQNPTAFRIAQARITNKSATGFGALVMIDEPLTVGPELSSKLVGRAQGKYNGSTLSVLGRNTILSTVRELPIVGGTGLFRFARGYALARTYSFDPTAPVMLGNAVVEYNVYVFHY